MSQLHLFELTRISAALLCLLDVPDDFKIKSFRVDSEPKWGVGGIRSYIGDIIAGLYCTGTCIGSSLPEGDIIQALHF